MDLNQLRELLAAIDQTNISELILKSDEFELTVRKGMSSSDRLPPPIDAALASAGGLSGLAAASSTLPGAVPVAPSPNTISITAGVSDNSTSLPAHSGIPAHLDKKWVEVISPMVGTFYRAPAPDEPAFVEIGDRITLGQAVCIIEAMKLMNEIEAEVSGHVLEILVQNGQPVEYGQALMRINPD